MNNKVYPPSEKLREYVLCYIIIDNDFSDIDQKVAMDIYPNGLSGICFTFGDPYFYENDEGRKNHLDAGTVVIGLHDCVFRLYPSQQQKHFVITLKQGVLPKILNIPMHEINDQVTDLQYFIKSEEDVIERLLLTNNVTEQIEIVEEWLTKKLRSIILYRDITSCAVSDIISHGGNVKIEELCRNYGVNKKYMERKFRESIGISPKKYSELVKLNTVIDLIISSYEKQWREISTAAGFNDYSHLGKHINKFTKQSPQMLRQTLYQSHSQGMITNNYLGVLSSLCVLNKDIG